MNADSITVNQSLFEVAYMRLPNRAAEGLPFFSPEATARQYSLARRAMCVVPDDKTRNELGEEQLHAFDLLAESPSADVEDIRRKLAAAAIELSDIGEGAPTAALLGIAFAELTRLTSVPLPVPIPHGRWRRSGWRCVRAAVRGAHPMA